MFSPSLMIRVIFAILLVLLIPSVGFAQTYGGMYPQEYLEDTARGYRNTVDLLVTISDAPEPVVDNQDLTYTIQVRNNMNYTERMRVEAFIDSQTRLLSASDRGIEFTDGVAVWENVIIGPESVKSLTLRVKTKTELQGDELRLRVNANGITAVETTRIDHRDTSVAPPAPPAFLGDASQNFQVLMSSSFANDTVHYEIIVANRTDRSVNGVHVTQYFDALTRDFQIVSAGGGIDKGDRITWSMGTLRPFESRTIKTSARFHSGIPRVRVEATSESPVQHASTVGLLKSVGPTPPPQSAYQQPMQAPNRYAYDDMNPPSYIYSGPINHRNVAYPQTGAAQDLFKKAEDMSQYLSSPTGSGTSFGGIVMTFTGVMLAGLSLGKRFLLI